MREVAAGDPSGNIFGKLLCTLALVVSLYVSIALLLANLGSLRLLRARQERATLVPATGSLVGVSAVDGSMWFPSDDSTDLLLIFGVATSGGLGDLRYWYQVAERSSALEGRVHLVGLCSNLEDACSEAGAQFAHLTILNFMDPVQTHALGIGALNSRALLFRDGRNYGFLGLTADVNTFVQKIVEASRRASEMG